MKIEHIAIWTKDLDAMKDFYLKYFDLTVNDKYHNPSRNFSSYFLSFENGARIELMHRPDISEFLHNAESKLGLTHFSIAIGSREKVDQLTKQIADDGYKILGKPRTTGDGYYESMIADVEGNLIELTI